jgi:CRP/FNR family transcriptional regulator
MLCLPAGVNRGDIAQLDAVVHKPPPFGRRETVFRTGDAFKYLFIVRSGSLKTVQTSQEGERQVMGFHLPGELVGLDAINENQHRCSAVALERTSLCAIPFERLESVAAELPSLQHQLLRIISREITQDHQHLATLGRRTARARLAVFVYDLSRRLEHAGYSAADFPVAMSRGDIANYLGLAQETVSRLCKTLSEEGLVQINRRQFRVLNPETLATLAGREAMSQSPRTANRR